MLYYPPAEKAESMNTDTPKTDVSIGDNPTLAVPSGESGVPPLHARTGGRFAAGDVILGRYTVLRELGEGGMGVVYQCLDSVGGVEVAVKGLPPEVSRNAEEMEDIRANYQLVRNLRHPNIAGVATLEQDKATGDYYLVMDLAQGVTLKSWMRRNPAAPRGTKMAILRQIAAALDYAHSEKVIHRDVKPENVMVDAEGRVKVLDFGLAAQIRSSQSRTSNVVTSKGGTPGYKSPEQWLGRPQRAAADVYSFGVLAYWMLAGHLPFDGDDPVVLGHAVISAPVEPVEGLPESMNAALAKALAKKPEERFSTCGAFMAALEGEGDLSRKERKDRKEEGGSQLATPANHANTGGAQLVAPETGGSRSRATAPLLIAAALALAALGGWWLFGGKNTRNENAGRARSPSAPQTATTNATPVALKPQVVTNEIVRVVTNEVVKVLQPQPQVPTNDTQQAEVARKAKEARERAAELVRLTTRLNIKVRDAKAKMAKIDAFREDSDGLERRIASADAQWQIIDKLVQPTDLDAATNALTAAVAAEEQISLDLDWLERNKAGRDAARSASAEIDALQKGDVATFKASKFAADAYGEGERLRAAGGAAFRKGEFAEAGRLTGEAKEKFAEAAREAKSFVIKTTLESAKTYFDAKQWQDCIAEADKVLGWEAGNESARKLKKEAESHLVPTLHVLAKVDGSEVSAKVKTGDKDFSTPCVWKLKEGSRYGPYEVSYENGGKRYYGTIDPVTVDWRGVRVVPVVLKEYTGPKHGDTKTITLPGGATMEMIYVVPGTFTMGSSSVEDERFDDEALHRVTLTKGFWLGKYEVTQEQWESVMGANPSRFKGGRNPVENVSWDDCQSFIRKINTQQNCGARLPTEAEWEYACRAGSTGPYAGNENLSDMGWYGGNSGNETHPVGQKQANAWGFYDMHGNVREWCGDWYDAYPDGSATDPAGPARGAFRVSRGGSGISGARLCRSAFRGRDEPGFRNIGLGFRVALAPSH